MGFRKRLIGASVFALLAISLHPSAFAGAEGTQITWSGPTNISGETDVRNDGSLVAAFNMNGLATTVNGVAFAAWTFPFMATTTSMGNFTITESPGHLTNRSSRPSISAPSAILARITGTSLAATTSSPDDDNNTITLTITGLTLGKTYEFQWWLNASQYAGTGPGFRTNASAPGTVSLDDNTTNQFGGLGQNVIGTFVAADTMEVITFNGADSTQAPTINAFQLRVVPEPSAAALLIYSTVIGGVLARWRRRSDG